MSPLRLSRCAVARALRALFVASLALPGGGRAAGAQDIQRGAQERREVHGVVRDSASGAPIAGALVSVVESKLSVRTDADGHYRLTGLLPRSATILVRHLGFAPVSRLADVSRGTAAVDVELARRATVLDEITIAAGAATRALGREQAVSTLSSAEVEQRRGQTLGETLKELPGVALIQYGPSIAKPVVRGLHSQRIATINSGIPQEGQQWGGEHAPEIDAFASNEIEVIRGPGTILYGSGALGGVVRVFPRPLPQGGGVGGELTTNGFSNNRQGAVSLLFEGNSAFPLGNIGPLGWRVQASARRAGDAETPGYFLPNTGFKELHYSGALGLRRAWGHSELSLSHFGTEIGLYEGAHVGNLDDLERAMDSAYTTPDFAYTLGRPNQEVQHDMVAWHTEVAAGRAASVEVDYGFQHNERREFDSRGFASTGKRPAFGLELYTHSFDVKYRHAPLGPLVGTIGVSGMRQGNLSPGRSFLIPQYRLYSGGVFALEQLVVSRLTLTGGLRYDARRQHAYQYGAPVVISPDDRSTYDGLSGSLGASLRLSDTWSLSGTAARAWRPPNVNERFSQGVHHGTAQYEIGDRWLVPERARNVDLTLRHAGARTRLEVSAYRNQIDDFIYLRPRDPVITVRGTYPAYNYAHANALLRGAEITLQVTPAEWLSLYANGNMVRGTDRDTRDPLYDMPADRLTMSARLFAPSTHAVEGAYVDVGTTQVRQQDRVPPITVYRLPTAGFGLLNLEVGATAIHIGALRVEPNLTIRNALNRRYREYLSRYRLFVNEPGRDVVVRLSVPFGRTH